MSELRYLSLYKENLIKTAVEKKDYPPCDRGEIALVGRSNSGKSSLINQILQKKEARISQRPGKTITLNFYDAGKHYRVVDMPGYGFAKRSNKESAGWKRMIEEYLSSRECLMGLILVMDCKRDWQQEEESIRLLCEDSNIPLLVAATKVDKLNTSEKKKTLDRLLKSALHPCFLVSNTKKQGIKELESYLYNEWVKK